MSKNIDWSNLGFGYMPTDYSFVSNFKNGEWSEGELTSDHSIVLNECAGVFQYAQTVFEGLKAYTTADGHIVTFRPDLNASRLADSARRLKIPPYDEAKFIEAAELSNYAAGVVVGKLGTASCTPPELIAYIRSSGRHS